MATAFVVTAFVQDDAAAAKAQWRREDQLRPKPRKLDAFMDEAEADVLADVDFPAAPGDAIQRSWVGQGVSR